MLSTIATLALVLCFHPVVGDWKVDWTNLANTNNQAYSETETSIKDPNQSTNSIWSTRMIGRTTDRSTTNICWSNGYFSNDMYCAANAGCMCPDNQGGCLQDDPIPNVERCQCSENYHGLYDDVSGYSCCKNDGTVVVKDKDGKAVTEQCCRNNVNAKNMKKGCNTDASCCDMVKGYKTAWDYTNKKYFVSNQINRGNGEATECKHNFKIPLCNACIDGFYDLDGTKCVIKKVDGITCSNDAQCNSNICKKGYCCNNISGKQCNECDSKGQCIDCQGKDYGVIPSPHPGKGICNKCKPSYFFKTTEELAPTKLPIDPSDYCWKRRDDGKICKYGLNLDRICKRINDVSVLGRCKDRCCKSTVPTIENGERSKCTACNENGLCDTCDKNGRGLLCELCVEGFYNSAGVCLERKDPGGSCTASEQCKALPGVDTNANICKGSLDKNFCCAVSAVLQSSCTDCSKGDGKCKLCGSARPDSSGKCPKSCDGSATKTVYKELAPVGKNCESLIFTRACNTGTGIWGEYSHSDGTSISKYSDSCKNGCTKIDTGLTAAHNGYIIFDRFKENEVNPGQQCDVQHLKTKCNNGVLENVKDSSDDTNTDIFGAKSCSIRW